MTQFSDDQQQDSPSRHAFDYDEEDDEMDEDEDLEESQDVATAPIQQQNSATSRKQIGSKGGAVVAGGRNKGVG